MASVVFMRGVNVGGHKAFRPSELASRLSSLDVVSIGAAGTFVVRASAGTAKIRNSFLKQIPFETELMICPAREVLNLVETNPFAVRLLPPADGQFISVIEERPRTIPKLPLRVPEGATAWQVSVIAIQGCFVATLMRRVGRKLLYPNEVVEKGLGVAATTRGWPTILKVREALC